MIKRLIFSVVIPFALCSALAACGGGDGTPGASTDPAQPTPQLKCAP